MIKIFHYFFILKRPETAWKNKPCILFFITLMEPSECTCANIGLCNIHGTKNYNKCNYNLGMWATIQYLSRKVLSQKNNVRKLTGRGKWIIDSVNSEWKKNYAGSKAFLYPKLKKSPTQIYFFSTELQWRKNY